MGILLEVKAGPFAGKKAAVVTGQTMTFGRAEGRAQFALPHDTFMSGVHFAVECGPNGCRALDRKSSNGTFLNGARIKDAMLANGDEIKSGQTIFSVTIVADSKLASLVEEQEAAAPAVAEPQPRADKPPRSAAPSRSKSGEVPAAAPAAPRSIPASVPARNAPVAEPPLPGTPRPPVPEPNVAARSAERRIETADAAFRQVERKETESSAGRRVGRARDFAFSVMGWSFPAAPDGWEVQEGFGLQQTGHEEFPSSVAASEEFLGGITLQQFVESQISMLRRYLRDPKIEPTMPPRVSGADESMAMDARHSTKDGRELVYRRIYARSGSSVGVLTVTTLASDFPQVLQSLQPLLDGAAFHSTVNN
ncbi:MAG: FHA domain-containing protein [Candidatus Acidiferrum sp.]